MTFELGAQVSRCEPPWVQSGSRVWEADRVWICAGDELQALFPEEFGQSGLIRCKLQMMRSSPLGSRLGPVLAAGLTLAHYQGFRGCPSLAMLIRRLAAELPEHTRFGIHVMVSQNEAAELTIGDSDQYGGRSGAIRQHRDRRADSRVPGPLP